jgi:hypothetical protein
VLVIRTPDERLTWLQALGPRRKEDVTAGVPPLFTGFLITDGYKARQRLLPQLAGIQQCCQHYPDIVVMPIPGPSVLARGVSGSWVSA